MRLQDEAAHIVAKVLAEKEPIGGVRNVVWVAAGGSNGGNYPAQYLKEKPIARLRSHPRSVLKPCQIRQLIEALEGRGSYDLQYHQVPRLCGHHRDI